MQKCFGAPETENLLQTAKFIKLAVSSWKEEEEELQRKKERKKDRKEEKKKKKKKKIISSDSFQHTAFHVREMLKPKFDSCSIIILVIFVKLRISVLFSSCLSAHRPTDLSKV